MVRLLHRLRRDMIHLYSEMQWVPGGNIQFFSLSFLLKLFIPITDSLSQWASGPTDLNNSSSPSQMAFHYR